MAEILTRLYYKYLQHQARRARLAGARPLRAQQGPRRRRPRRRAGRPGLLRQGAPARVQPLQEPASACTSTATRCRASTPPPARSATACSMAVGMALGARFQKQTWRTYCMLGDGECNEGSDLGGRHGRAHFKLDNLTAFVDRNHFMIDGRTEDIMSLEPFADKWSAFGWEVREVDGHDFAAARPRPSSSPRRRRASPVIICQHRQGQGRRLHGKPGQVALRQPRLGAGRQGQGQHPDSGRRHKGRRAGRGRCVMTEVTGTTWNVYDANTLTQAEIYGRVLCELGERDPRIVALTADLAKPHQDRRLRRQVPRARSSTSASPSRTCSASRRAWPRRACCRSSPPCRPSPPCAPCEQVRTDICYQNLNVKIIATHGGMSLRPGRHHAPLHRGHRHHALAGQHDGDRAGRRLRDGQRGARRVRAPRPGLHPHRPRLRAHALRERGLRLRDRQGGDHQRGHRHHGHRLRRRRLPRRRGRQDAQGPGRHQRARAQRAHDQAHRRRRPS